MRCVLIVLLGIAAWSLSWSGARAATPTAILQSCEAVLQGTRGSEGRNVDIPAAGLPCWYYMSAVQNMSVIVDENGEHVLGVCAPSATTLMQYVESFVRYARKSRQRPDGNPAALAIAGLSEAYPCDGTVVLR